MTDLIIKHIHRDFNRLSEIILNEKNESKHLPIIKKMVKSFGSNYGDDFPGLNNLLSEKLEVLEGGFEACTHSTEYRNKAGNIEICDNCGHLFKNNVIDSVVVNEVELCQNCEGKGYHQEGEHRNECAICVGAGHN